MKIVRVTLPVALIATLLACGGGGGSSSSTAPICGPTSYVPNYATASGLTLRRWSSLPVSVFFKTTTPKGTTTVEELCRQGFNQWEAALGRDLWQEVGLESVADLVVTISTVSPQSTLGITTVFFNSGSNIITSSDMTIYNWSSLSAASLPGTAAHELGHAFGIGGHSGSNLDLMYFTGNATDLLTTRDLNTVRTAYCDFASAAKESAARTRSREGLESETMVCGHVH